MLNQSTEDKPTLTARQKEIYEFLKDKILNRGYGPTVREIGAEFGIRSPNGVMCHLKALEKKGLITRESHMSRAIQLAVPPQQRMSLPLAGTLSAGNTIRPIPEEEKIDFASIFEAESHACIRVQGDGFSNQGINAGDYLVVLPTTEFAEGQLILAIGPDGARIGKGLHQGDQIRIQAGPADSVPVPIDSIVGSIIAVIRQTV